MTDPTKSMVESAELWKIMLENVEWMAENEDDPADREMWVTVRTSMRNLRFEYRQLRTEADRALTPSPAPTPPSNVNERTKPTKPDNAPGRTTEPDPTTDT